MIGRVAGFRGPAGELTVRVVSGVAARWTGGSRVLLEREGSPAVPYRVEAARAYGGTLVLKLAGVDDPGAAEALRGCGVRVPADEVPALPPGEHWVARLCGLPVVDETAGPLGRVEDVEETGGVDLLRVVGTRGEVHIPLAGEIVTSIGEEEIRVRLPEGLLDLNREDGA
ncbi:MAG TPA: ribosome maturation factor RimM [Candidatus Polarisedimenticolaceae bacterium]|nr:ribosome maturation factor RimM [Candidatus Polarisedimenticolaceae bacterium]